MKRIHVTIVILAALTGLGIVLADMPTVSTRVPGQITPTPVPLGTVQHRWQRMRTVTASDTPMTGITKAWTTIKSKFTKIPSTANYVRIACYADGDGSAEGDPNGGSFSWKLFICDEFGSAQEVGYGTWAIGELALSHDPDPATGTETALTYGTTDPDSSKWGELPVLTASYFGGPDVSGTTDDIGSIKFDSGGAYGVWLEVTSLSNVTNLYIMLKDY